ncbi:esterase/lipase family protein [Psychromonas sp. MB-3u-54]|uniref:esterase/lipase family protein n=1 Tax=Psychromonas sp. MB-3u-54 TaxID=2058319 RepID=UPI0018E3F9EE|nr:phospholipase [Psychromonas sp. MB-3u-54]
MIVIFIHGWSVVDTSTYGLLPEALAEQANQYKLKIEIKHIWLGRYISFNDEVNVADIARAFHDSLHDQISDGIGGIADFSCITHSTGGPVVREWLDRFYRGSLLSQSPLRHLVMLAPANHGSPLAALGKQRVGRIKAWFSGVEPGQRILDWLSLGSQQQIDLAQSYLKYKPAEHKFFPFVLTGQTIDKKLYDFVNSYLAEAGSDGVVRVACANINYSMIKLVETKKFETVTHGADEIKVQLLKVEGKLQRPSLAPLGVIPGASHSGKDKGIMRSVLSAKAKNKPQVSEILKCLTVDSKADYTDRANALEVLTKETQKGTHRYVMLVFIIKDDQGDPVNDYDLFLLGGDSHNPNNLTKGFFVDRQKNVAHPNHLVYYIDYDLVTKNKLTGFRIIARPDDGFVFYHVVEYHANGIDINDFMKPNETFYVEIQLHRCVDKNVFRVDNASDPKLRKEGFIIKSETRHSFKNEKPMKKEVEKS